MIPALAVLSAALLFGLGFWLRARFRRAAVAEARNVLVEVAERLSLPRRLDAGGGLKFERRGFPAALSVHAGARLNVEVSFRLGGEVPGWITVSSLGLKRALLEQIGLRDVQVGDAEFDRRLEVWGSDQEDIRLRLVPAIRNMLLQVDRRWDFMWRLAPDQFVLRVRIDPLERFQVETLAGIAFQILDILDLRSPSDFVVSHVQEKLDGATRCPVCGTPLSKGAIVRCSKCRAAHHADCWDFNGLCATFACGSQAHEL
ncbi:MAG TPA: RING finger protein [Planctomycetota bacterium]|nr:RING finger protein [Planctomycetota bacterium]